MRKLSVNQKARRGRAWRRQDLSASRAMRKSTEVWKVDIELSISTSLAFWTNVCGRRSKMWCFGQHKVPCWLVGQRRYEQCKAIKETNVSFQVPKVLWRGVQRIWLNNGSTWLSVHPLLQFEKLHWFWMDKAHRKPCHRVHLPSFPQFHSWSCFGHFEGLAGPMMAEGLPADVTGSVVHLCTSGS